MIATHALFFDLFIYDDVIDGHPIRGGAGAGMDGYISLDRASYERRGKLLVIVMGVLMEYGKIESGRRVPLAPQRAREGADC